MAGSDIQAAPVDDLLAFPARRKRLRIRRTRIEHVAADHLQEGGLELRLTFFSGPHRRQGP